MYALLLSDENMSLRDRAWLVYTLWIAGHVGAAVVAVLAARGFLGRRLEPAAPNDRNGHALTARNQPHAARSDVLGADQK